MLTSVWMQKFVEVNLKIAETLPDLSYVSVNVDMKSKMASAQVIRGFYLHALLGLITSH